MAEYIEREAVFEQFGNGEADVIEMYTDGSVDFGFGASNIRDLINAIPAADVAPVAHGRWAETDMVEVDNHGEIYRIPNAGKRCSWCMCVFDKKLLWRDSYCPNCGARMDGDAERRTT